MSETIITRSTLAALGIAHGDAAGKSRRAYRVYRDSVERARVRAATDDATKDEIGADELGHAWRERREGQFTLFRQIARTPATSWAEIDVKPQALLSARAGLPETHPSAASLLAMAESIAADMRRLIEKAG